MTLKEQKAAILEGFDFMQLRRQMGRMDWRWAKSPGRGYAAAVPTVRRLRESAERLLDSVIDSPAGEHWIESGGFRAEKRNGRLALRFVVEQSVIIVNEEGCMEVHN